MAEEIEVPVVIVGGGPIGLTLSCILGNNNIRHVLLEKNETTSKWPKAMLTNTRSMELYHRLGLDALLRKQALSGSDMIFGSQSLINEEPFIHGDFKQMVGKNPNQEPDGTFTYDEQWTVESICKISQTLIEPILKTASSQNLSSEINFGWEVKSISQTQENVLVEAVNVKSGEKKMYRASYAVGCDGGKSFVRKSLDIHFKGGDVGDMRSVSFESKELKKRLVRDDVLGIFVVKPNLVALTLPLNTEGHYVAHCIQQDKDSTPDEILKTLLDDEDIPYTISFVSNWQGHFAYAETMQENRVFLAGDSCHLMVPVGGFGMNTGILDAFDIGWKLVATIQGWGGQRLLASYTAERLPSVRKVLDKIGQAFYAMRKYGRIWSFLLSTRPFKYIMRMFMNTSRMDLGLTGILFGIRLDSSPLCIPSGSPLPPEDPSHYTPIAYPGCRAPHFQFKDGTSLSDKLGSVFTLLHLQPSNQNYDAILTAAAHCGMPLKVLPLNDQKLKTLYREMDLVLIRPDLYIAWCGNEIPTLLHNDDVKEGARILIKRILIKVITGAANLPAEWQRSRKTKRTLRAAWWIPLAVSLVVGASAATIALLNRYKGIN